MSEWQPIETAPKDGSDIIGYANGLVFSCRWVPACAPGSDDLGHDAGWLDHIGYCDAGNTLVTDAYQWEPHNQPTHWMPLPKPPVTP